MGAKRLEFANQLRAVAALAVVASHFLGVFWTSPVGVGNLLGVAPLPLTPTSLPGAQYFLSSNVFFGQFGVAVFFLISGFVIPLSLESKRFAPFLVERFFRIYPVYIIGFSIVILSSLFVSNYFSGEYKYSSSQIFVHYFIIVRQWFGSPRIDGVSWTLEIELYYYLYISIMTTVLIHKKHIILILSLLLFFGASSLVFPHKETWYIGRQLSVLQFMFIGVCLGYYHVGSIGLLFMISYVSTSIILFTLVFMNTFLYENFTGWLTGYLVAFVIFFGSYFIRSSFRQSRILSHFADISYPLYAIHALTGYAAIYFLLQHGFSPWISVGIAFAAIYVLSVLVHLFVEKPALSFGKQMAKKVSSST